jgi:transposase
MGRAELHKERTMGKHKLLAFVAFDNAREKHAAAIADDGRDGELRYLGEIGNSPASGSWWQS